jgi:hypothetical protein
MTELERARAHLQDCQAELWQVRARGYWGHVEHKERAVLAALCWVWEEQERCEGDFVFPRAPASERFIRALP